MSTPAGALSEHTLRSLLEQAHREIDAIRSDRDNWMALAKSGGTKCTPEHTWAEWLADRNATIDALQAQVEVLEAAIVKALLMHASGDLQIAYNDPTWLNQARAALSPIKASDADRREVKT